MRSIDAFVEIARKIVRPLLTIGLCAAWVVALFRGLDSASGDIGPVAAGLIAWWFSERQRERAK